MTDINHLTVVTNARGGVEFWAAGTAGPGVPADLYRSVDTGFDVVWARVEAPPGGGGTLYSAPGLHPDLLVNSGDDVPFCRTWDDDWSGWTSLGRPEAGFHVVDAAAVRRDDGGLDVVVTGARGSDGARRAVWHRRRSADGRWAGWTSLKGEFWGEISAGVNTDGRLEVFVPVGEDDHGIAHRFQKADGTWQAWGDFGTVEGLDNSVRPVVVRNADGRLKVFATDGSRAVWHRWQLTPGGNWAPWTKLSALPGSMAGTFTAALEADGRLKLVVPVSVGGKQKIVTRRQGAPGQAWESWRTLHDENGDEFPGIDQIFALTWPTEPRPTVAWHATAWEDREPETRWMFEDTPGTLAWGGSISDVQDDDPLAAEIAQPVRLILPTLKKGDSGGAVTRLQQMLVPFFGVGEPGRTSCPSRPPASSTRSRKQRSGASRRFRAWGTRRWRPA